MEIRFSTDGDSPHYLAQFVFSRTDDIILLEVVDRRNTQKCVAHVPIEQFRESMAFLGCIKQVTSE